MNRSSVGVIAAVIAGFLTLPLSGRAGSLAAQQSTGRVVGRIIDKTSGRGLSDAGIQVVGTTLGTTSQLDGRYMLPAVPAGTVTLQVRLLGYQAKTVTGIFLGAGDAVEQDVALETATVQLTAQVVTADAERGSVSAALDQQRNATGIVNAVTSEQISRSPDSDAAAAVQRVSGVTVQDGKFVFVRGLGERYTTTSLNGARLPSPEPEKKVVPLDLFPASLLQSVTTSKTFTPDQPGDFSGAQVNVVTREFPAKPQITLSSSIGYNDAATGSTIVSAPRVGLEWLGFSGTERLLPGLVRSAGTFEPQPSPAEVNSIVGSFRNAWSIRERSGTPNTSFSASAGGNSPVFGQRVGYTGSLTYRYAQEIKRNEVRAYPSERGDREIDRFEGSTGRASVLWGGLVNLSTLIGSNTRLSFNNSYSRTADNDARSESGISENHGAPLLIDRLRFVERSVRANQLSGQHQLGERHRVDWTVTSSGVTRKEPDRSEFVYIVPADATGRPMPPEWITGSEGAVRTFGNLAETSTSGSANYTLLFGDPARQHSLKTGGLLQRTSRDAETRSYSIQGTGIVGSDRRLRPEEIFDGRFTSPDASPFRVAPLSQGGSYDASDDLVAGFGMLEYALTGRIRVIAGARVENSRVEVNAEPTVGAPVRTRPKYTDVLPSAAVNYNVAQNQNLRFSLSQTLARPEYRELSPIQYRDVIGGEVVQGNPSLRRTLIQNADVRWEWYPNADEVLSIGLFAKRFKDPIERIYLGTSGSRLVTFLNADGARNYGVELDARKHLGFLIRSLTPVTIFTNATVMRSEIEIGRGSSGAGAGSEINDRRQMVGQAPYVVNAGATFATERGRMSATVLYNIVGRRIVSAAELGLPNVYEEARNVLDVSLRFPVLAGISAKLDAKNLLNEPYEVTQGVATREYYEAGRVFTFGLAWHR